MTSSDGTEMNWGYEVVGACFLGRNANRVSRCGGLQPTQLTVYEVFS